MKLLKKLLLVIGICAAGFGIYKLLQRDPVEEMLYELLGEDLYLALQERFNLVGDLLSWPVSFISALLP